MGTIFIPYPVSPIGGNDAFTVALLHCEGADASTTFTNSAAGGSSAWTAFGNAQIDTAQFKFGSASALFDGTGDGVFADGSADFAFGTADFTIDCWVRLNALGAGKMIYDGRVNGGGANQARPSIYVNTDNTLRYFATNADRITGATALTTGTWYHVALARASGSTRMFLDGVQQGSTYADATNYTAATSRPVIGVAGTDGATFPMNGWIDEVRVSKGIARWTANFTPPTGPYS